jgi:hypothetical protein
MNTLSEYVFHNQRLPAGAMYHAERTSLWSQHRQAGVAGAGEVTCVALVDIHSTRATMTQHLGQSLMLMKSLCPRRAPPQCHLLRTTTATADMMLLPCQTLPWKSKLLVTHADEGE